MSKEEQISKLEFKRKVSMKRLEEISNYGSNSTNDPFFKQNFLARCEFVDSFYEEFQEHHNAIISLISTDKEFLPQDEIRKKVDTHLYAIKGKHLEITSSNTNISTNNLNVSTSGTMAKLPKINVPTFDGNLKMWPSFFDLFNNIIHNNSHLSQIEKFHYLLTSLKNEAFNLVKSIPMTEQNYPIAYDTLITRFQNKRFLATTYFNEIYSAPAIQKPSSKELRYLLDVFAESLASLKVLNFDVDSWDFLIFNILLQKLDFKTRTNFEVECSKIDMPTYEMLKTFLNKQCKALESMQYMMPQGPNSKIKSTPFSPQQSSQYPNSKKHPSSAFVGTVDDPIDQVQTQNSSKCVICSASHALYRCPQFLTKPPHERLALVRQNNLCVNCLRSKQHSVRNCPSIKCKLCQFPHHTTLHLNNHKSTGPPTSNANDNSFQSSPAPETAGQSSSALQCSTPALLKKQHTVLLSTAQVDVRDIRGNFQKVRVLLDTASMANFISEKCANKLGLKRYNVAVPLEGINSVVSTSRHGMTNCFIKPCDKSDPTFSFEALILPKICSDQPKVPIDPQRWSHIKTLRLADDVFHNPGPIDLLLGAELVPYLLSSGRIFGEPGQPVALETVFGWVLQGKTDCSSQTTTLLACHASLEPQTDITIQKFWEIETIPTVGKFWSSDDIKCENIYQAQTFRDDSGRFVVPLPFKHKEPTFGDSHTQALRRFLSLESRLYKNPTLHTGYSNFIQEYISNNYISEVPFSDYHSSSAFYLPHHCVVKPDSTSTKIRVVFDASAKSSNGLSLNDTLFSGPKLHQDLSSILLNFRTYPVAFISDIKQMYCQIVVKPEHRRFQRFLWRFSRSHEIKEYSLNRVTFGVSAAPYLALRTLKELGLLEQQNYPLASKALKESLYIDDCVLGADSIESALQLQSELIALLEKGGFELRKWASNKPEIMAAVPHSNIQMPLNFESEGPFFIKVLGLQWDPTLDIFTYSFSPIESECTKRSILSQIARIFDPLGFLAPISFFAKHILQQLWLSKMDWDDVPTDDVVEAWSRFKSELPEISKIGIPRLLFSDKVSRLEMHGFCDASTKGYGCVIYFRIISFSGIKITLISGKSKVAPLKVISLPRLELCAALLLADLVKFVKESYSKLLTIDELYAWSDSQVALGWISASPHRWKTFIANRVAHIQEVLPPSSWRYVPTSENPADCASRGLTPSQLLQHDLWFQGPTFLGKASTSWPEQPLILINNYPDIIKEESHVTLHVSVKSSLITDLLNKFSSLRKIQRVLAYVLNFITNARKLRNNSFSSILSQSLLLIVKQVQTEYFDDIFRACKRDFALPKPFRKLAPFIDEAGILRVGGRLRKSALSFDAKHPILLPKDCRLTDLIIEQFHAENLHPGLKTMHNLIIQNFWILSPRSAIYRCLSKCIKCFRSKPRSYIPFMADLPDFRISQIKAFSSVALDYAGPFTITMGKHRGAKTSKAYICVFVCCSTKAMHLELASDLSSEAFLACFRRLISRRGRVSNIYSDQGTNFKGAYNLLNSFSEAASKALSLKWHFNPPGSPHFNGLSEAGVKSVKTHLYRVVGAQILTFEEFYTFLTQIESLLNSRPLTTLSEDPNDFAPLTPGHFLTMEPLTSFPEPELSAVPLNRLTRWQLLQRMHADFWKRWSQEYLHTLQQRCKWTKSIPNIKLGTLVLIKNEQKPPLEWALGRVVKLHAGDDDVVRVVTVRVQNGTLQRPVVKLCPLPGQ